MNSLIYCEKVDRAFLLESFNDDNVESMRILVTGGSGFIGTNYIEFLVKDGQAEFINLDHKPLLNPDHKGFWQNPCC